MAFSQEQFNSFVLDNNTIGFFPNPIKLVSGRESHWYVNWRTISSDVYLMEQLSDFVLEFMADSGIGINCFYGTPDGATKLAVLCQYKWAKQQPDFAPGKYVLAMGRKTPKDHGDPKDRFFVGAPQGRVAVLEDVTTTAGSLLKTVDTLQQTGVTVAAALALTSRNAKTEEGQTTAEALAERKVPYLAMSQALELLPLLAQRTEISPEIRASIAREFAQYGEQKLNL